MAEAKPLAGNTRSSPAAAAASGRAIAPYKYPRAIEFTTSLPRTETGKLQRFHLRQQELAKAPQRP
jgi:2-aminobenzoate-CoA ligase